MEHDMLPSFPMQDNLLLLDPSFFLSPPTCFSPRDVQSLSPRGFLATFAPTLAYLPDTIDWDSQAGSVGSRRASDEFSEASAKQQLTAGWNKVMLPGVSALHHHKKSDEDEAKVFPCKEPGCNKIYTTTEGLRLHNRNIHMNDKRHKCHIEGCDRAFVRASDLKLHTLRIHESERPYPCTEPDCTKSFACNSELTRHLNCHSRNKTSRKKQRRSSDSEDDDN